MNEHLVIDDFLKTLLELKELLEKEEQQSQK